MATQDHTKPKEIKQGHLTPNKAIKVLTRQFNIIMYHIRLHFAAIVSFFFVPCAHFLFHSTFFVPLHTFFQLNIFCSLAHFLFHLEHFPLIFPRQEDEEQ